MVSYGRKRYGDNKRLSFVKLDIQTPDLPIDLVGGFDHAISCFCLKQCQNLKLVEHSSLSMNEQRKRALKFSSCVQTYHYGNKVHYDSHFRTGI